MLQTNVKYVPSPAMENIYFTNSIANIKEGEKHKDVICKSQ
jgi:hypothetical protein